VLGFELELFGANPDDPFAKWHYRGSGAWMAPFRGLFELYAGFTRRGRETPQPLG
jgi:hypothetical protein